MRDWRSAGLCCFLLAGCSNGDDFPTATVHGRVLVKGVPVKEGRLFFAPQGNGAADAGKAALAVIDSEGKYQLSTYGVNDGAVIGKHKVTYFGPPSPPDGDDIPAAYKVAPGLEDKEVKPGDNEIDIEVIPSPQRKPR